MKEEVGVAIIEEKVASEVVETEMMGDQEDSIMVTEVVVVIEEVEITGKTEISEDPLAQEEVTVVMKEEGMVEIEIIEAEMIEEMEMALEVEMREEIIIEDDNVIKIISINSYFHILMQCLLTTN